MKTFVCLLQIPARILLSFGAGYSITLFMLALCGGLGVANAAAPLVSNVSRFTRINDFSYREETGALLRNGEFRLRVSFTGQFAPGDKEQLQLIEGRTVMWVEAYQIYQNAGVIPNWVTRSVATYPFGTLDYFILGARGGPDPNPVPVFTDEPEDTVTVVGDSLFLWGWAEPGEQVSYQWLKNGKPIPGETEFSLYISECSKADRGRYSLRANIGGNVAVSGTATITIVNAVTLRRDLKDISVRSGRTATLRVSATGTPPLRYQWFHDYVAIVGATSPRLVIRNASEADAGDYYVQVSNDFSDDDSRSMYLTVTP